MYNEISSSHAAVVSPDVLAARGADRDPLLQNLQEWERTFDTIPDLVAIVSDQFQIVRVNQAMATQLGVAPAEVVGRNCFDTFRGLGCSSRGCACRTVFADGEVRRFETHDEQSGRDFLLTVNPLRSPDGRVCGSVHVARDITALKQAEAVLRSARDDLEERVKERTALIAAVLGSLPSRIAVLDRNGVVLDVNEHWMQAPEQQLAPCVAHMQVGMNYFDICSQLAEAAVSADQADKTQAVFTPSCWEGDGKKIACSNRIRVEEKLEAIRSVLSGTRGRFDQEYACPTSDGDRWFLMTVVPLKHPNGGAVIAHTDITERKLAQAEAARQREELAHVGRVNAIGELAASLAHEINQPLTAIMNNADAAMLALNAGVAPLEDLREILEDIATDGSRAGDVILRLRAQLQCRPMDFRLLDLNELIRKTTGFVRSDAAMRDIRVVVQLDSAPLLVRGDGVQLVQVVINLALNAFDAMRSVPTKRRQVTLSTRLQDTQTVVTTVRDRGSGLAAADIERIFEPFYTTKANGLGMGLSIARSILAVHGGRLWVESYPDAGSTFFFSLPCASDAKEGVS